MLKTHGIPENGPCPSGWIVQASMQVRPLRLVLGVGDLAVKRLMLRLRSNNGCSCDSKVVLQQVLRGQNYCRWIKSNLWFVLYFQPQLMVELNHETSASMSPGEQFVTNRSGCFWNYVTICNTFKKKGCHTLPYYTKFNWSQQAVTDF